MIYIEKINSRHNTSIIRRLLFFSSCAIGYAVVFFLLALIPDISAASAVSADWKEHLKNGKKDLDEGRYEEAVRHLSAAGEKPSILGDYVLLYLSGAFHKMGEHGKALDAVRGLIEKYPHSPILKKARLAEISEVKEIPGGNVG